MKYLLYADAVLLAAGAAMSVTLGVVCLLFAIYHGVSPEITRGLPALETLTAGFLGLTLFAAAAWHGVRRARPWKWLAQAALTAVVPLLVMTAIAVLRS
jgi:hypothetical protein